MKKYERIIIAVIIALSVLGYGLINYTFKAKKEKVAMEEKRLYENKLYQCRITCQDDYTTNWNSNCRSRGVEDFSDLPLREGDELKEDRDICFSNCIKMYSR